MANKLRVFDAAKNKVDVWEIDQSKPIYVLTNHSDIISDNLIKNGRWEGSIMDRAKGFLTKNSNCLDIGANMGTWSLQLADWCSEGRIWSFEPQLSTFNQLCTHIHINGFKNIIPNRCALSSHEKSGTTMMMGVDPYNNGGTMLKDYMDVIQYSREEYIQVPVKCLDDFIEEIPKIDLIKMDVELSEIDVLRGGVRFLERDRPIIFFESCVHEEKQRPIREELFRWFDNFGYVITHISDSDFFATFDTDKPRVMARDVELKSDSQTLVSQPVECSSFNPCSIRNRTSSLIIFIKILTSICFIAIFTKILWSCIKNHKKKKENPERYKNGYMDYKFERFR